MAARKTLKQLIEKHDTDAVYAERKSAEWATKAQRSRQRAEALRIQAKEAAE